MEAIASLYSDASLSINCVNYCHGARTEHGTVVDPL